MGKPVLLTKFPLTHLPVSFAEMFLQSSSIFSSFFCQVICLHCLNMEHTSLSFTSLNCSISLLSFNSHVVNAPSSVYLSQVKFHLWNWAHDLFLIPTAPSLLFALVLMSTYLGQPEPSLLFNIPLWHLFLASDHPQTTQPCEQSSHAVASVFPAFSTTGPQLCTELPLP